MVDNANFINAVLLSGNIIEFGTVAIGQYVALTYDIGYYKRVVQSEQLDMYFISYAKFAVIYLNHSKGFISYTF